MKNNYLQKIPDLKELPSLSVLNLNTNKISQIKLQITQQNMLNLEILDLSNNLIAFQRDNEINEVTEQFKKFKKLSNLSLRGNERIEEKHEEIASSLPACVQIFNNKRVELLRKDIADQILKDSKKTYGNPQLDRLSKKSKAALRDENYVPTLKMLCYNLEVAISHPNKALEYLELLFYDADRISHITDIKHESFQEQLFQDLDEATAKEMIETFMQNTILMIDSSREYCVLIISMLAKLTNIKRFKFGKQCFNTLRELMMSGQDNEK